MSLDLYRVDRTPLQAEVDRYTEQVLVPHNLRISQDIFFAPQPNKDLVREAAKKVHPLGVRPLRGE